MKIIKLNRNTPISKYRLLISNNRVKHDVVAQKPLSVVRMNLERYAEELSPETYIKMKAYCAQIEQLCYRY